MKFYVYTLFTSTQMPSFAMLPSYLLILLRCQMLEARDLYVFKTFIQQNSRTASLATSLSNRTSFPTMCSVHIHARVHLFCKAFDGFVYRSMRLILVAPIFLACPFYSCLWLRLHLSFCPALLFRHDELLDSALANLSCFSVKSLHFIFRIFQLVALSYPTGRWDLSVANDW